MTTFRAVMELKRLSSVKAKPKNKIKARKNKAAARQLYRERKKDGIDVSRLRRPWSRDNTPRY